MKTTSFKKYLCAGILLCLALSLCLVTVSAAAPEASGLNSAPVARNVELTTYRGVAVTGSFSCLDPEGDAVTYSVASEPRKGTVEIDGDTFTYTPAAGKKGKDTFTYVASDTAGNVSDPASVTVNIKKQESGVTYSDMDGNSARYAATVLAEEGIFVGEQLGGRYLFRPEAAVTRGEFLVMCMKMRGGSILDGIVRTGFYDDELIPDWQKPYVTTAVTGDIITGLTDADGRIVFSPDRPITFAEASVMLDNALAITDVSLGALPEYAPSWAVQAAGNLSSCDIIDDISTGVSSATVTRADAARLLLGALEVKSSRSTRLLTWAE